MVGNVLRFFEGRVGLRRPVSNARLLTHCSHDFDPQGARIRPVHFCVECVTYDCIELPRTARNGLDSR